MKKIKTAPFIPNRYETEVVENGHARVSIYPFEAGYAITLAHPLKRIMLSSTVGFAPTALKIEGASHEFDSIRGVLEDVAALIINLKNIRFKIKNDAHRVTVNYTFSGPAEIKGSSFNNDDIEVVNPDAHFATINEDGQLNLSIVVEKGMGYVPSEDIRDTSPEGYLPLDAYFMPVKKANYDIEKVLVEDNPNFEKIVFDVVTDGQADPVEIFQDAVTTMMKQLGVFGTQIEAPVAAAVELSKENDESFQKMMMKIEELNLSARSHNCLNRSNIRYVGEIIIMSDSELAKVKNLGKKSLEEIKQKVVDLELTGDSTPPSDIVDAFKQKLAELKG